MMSSEAINAVVPILPVRDLMRAIEFYEQLGFTAKRYRTQEPQLRSKHSAGRPGAIVEPLAPGEWKMKEFVLRDPDGNRLIFGESLTEDQQQL